MNTNVPDTYAKEGSLAYSAFMEGSTMYEDLKLALLTSFFTVAKVIQWALLCFKGFGLIITYIETYLQLH